jgi:hypothetical protein
VSPTRPSSGVVNTVYGMSRSRVLRGVPTKHDLMIR